MNPFDLDDKVMAATIAAAGTILGALIQLRITWRKELSERARGVPVSKKSRRGPVLAIGVLLVAAAVGGFAIAQVWLRPSDRESAEARAALESQVASLSATAARLERATLSARPEAPAVLREGDVETAMTTVAACRSRVPTEPRACEEQDAVPVSLCAGVPAAAVVTGTALYARAAGGTQPWNEHLALPGQDLGNARFIDAPAERDGADGMKDVCASFVSWDATRGYDIRLAVSVRAAPRPAEATAATLTPVAGVPR